jgi:ribosomal protein S27AE
MILIASFYIDYQVCIASKQKELGQYYEFVNLLGQRMQRHGLALSKKHGLDQPAFYEGDLGFVSLNYDPILLWLQFLANRDLNKSKDVPHLGSPRTPLHLFHDFGHLIPARRIGRGDDDWPWYPLNEGAAQRLNELKKGDQRIRLTKFLFPHGCLCWRECPDCGKLSAYHGDKWSLDSSGLFPPPPLRAFDASPCPKWVTGDEREQRTKGKIDARKCLHCGTLTFAHHTQAVMQSSFKPRPPSFIEEIQRDLRATTMQGDHIIFMGYSLPPDDVTYRAFFSARQQRHGTQVHLHRH